MAQFQELPTEIVEKIFDYCYYMDVENRKSHFKSLALVCHKWLEIMEVFHRKYFWVHVKYEVEENPTFIFQKSFRNFYNIILIGDDNLSEFDYNPDMIEYFLHFLTFPNIKTTLLALMYLNFNIDILCKIMTPLKYLKEITIMSCLFPYNEIIKSDKINKISNIISQLTNLCYIGNNANLKSLLEIVTHTKKLNFFQIEINTFELTNKNIDKEEQINYFNNAMYNILRNNSTTLKGLTLNSDYINNNDFLLLLNSLQSINIKILSLKRISNLQNLYFFLRSNIVDLELEFVRKPEIDFKIISEMLKSVKFLTLRNGNLKNFNLCTISKFEQLISLHLTVCQFDYKTNTRIPIIKNLKYLTIWNSDGIIGNKIYVDIAENVPNLEELSIVSSNLDNEGVQSIIKKLSKLTNLSISERDSNKLTNYSITGFNEESKKQDGYSIKNLRNLIELKIESIELTKISFLNLEFPKLQKLDIETKGMDENLLTKLILNCPELKLLTLSEFIDHTKCIELKKDIDYKYFGGLSHNYVITSFDNNQYKESYHQICNRFSSLSKLNKYSLQL